MNPTPSTILFQRLLRRWLPPFAGAAVALALIFYLCRDLDFDRLLEGLRQASSGWIGVLAFAILLE